MGGFCLISRSWEGIFFEFDSMLPCCKWAVNMSCHNCACLLFSVPSLLSPPNWLKIIDLNPFSSVWIGCVLRQSFTPLPLSFFSSGVICFGSVAATNQHGPLAHAHVSPPLIFSLYWFSSYGLLIELWPKTWCIFLSKQRVRGTCCLRGRRRERWKERLKHTIWFVSFKLDRICRETTGKGPRKAMWPTCCEVKGMLGTSPWASRSISVNDVSSSKRCWSVGRPQHFCHTTPTDGCLFYAHKRIVRNDPWCS